MKPEDIFIDSRQLFGYVPAGVLWVTGLFLIVTSRTLDEVIAYAGGANLLGTAIFLALALFSGVLFQEFWFNCTRRWTRKSYLKRTKAFPHAEQLERAYKILLDKYKYSMAIPPAVSEYRYRRDVFSLCKRSVVGREPELGKMLVRREAEINLVGMLPFPLLVFLVGFATHLHQLCALHIRGRAVWWWSITVPLAIVIFAFLFRAFVRMRLDEEREAFDAFFMTEQGLGAKAPRT